MGKVTKIKKVVALSESLLIGLGLAACAKHAEVEPTEVETTSIVSELTDEKITRNEKDYAEVSFEEEYANIFNDILNKYPKLIGNISYTIDADGVTLKIENVDDCDELSLFVQELTKYYYFEKLVIDAQSFDGLAFDKSQVEELEVYSNDGLYPKTFSFRDYTSLKKLTLVDVEAKDLPIIVQDISMTATSDSYDYVEGFHSLVSYEDFTEEEKESGLHFSDEVNITLDGMRLQDFWAVGNSGTLTLNNCYGNSNMNIYSDDYTLNNNSEDAYINLTDGVVREFLVINDPYDNVSNIENVDLNKDAKLVYNDSSKICLQPVR